MSKRFCPSPLVVSASKMAARSVEPEGFPLCASNASQPQPLVGLRSTGQERNRCRYIKSVSCGFVEVADERLTSQELKRILVAKEPGVAEKYALELKARLESVPGVTSVTWCKPKSGCGNTGESSGRFWGISAQEDKDRRQ